MRNLGSINEEMTMKVNFLPDYARPQTPQEIKKANERIRKFEYYGIEYNNLDGGELAESKKEKDRDEARILILMGKEIPKDLEERLLRYKDEDERSTNESK